MSAAPVLRCSGLVAGYPARPVIHGCDFEVPAGTVMGMVGHNGAGKTTLLRALMGQCVVEAGDVQLDGRSISQLSTAQRSLAGLGYVPQERKVFPGLSVAENLDVVVRQAAPPAERAERVAQCLTWFPRLSERYRVTAGSLSGGEQQMVGIALALLRRPQILLLDEPSLGLAPKLTEDMLATIARICRETDVAALVVEQNLHYLRIVTGQALVVRLGEVSGPVDITGDVADLTAVF